MKFSIKRTAFLSYLSDILRAIPSKTAIPILTGVKLVLSREGLLLTGSNADISIETFLSADDENLDLQIDETGSIVLTARFFNDVVKKLPADTFTFASDEQLQTKLTSGAAEFTLIGQSAADYPRLPEVEDNGELQLSAQQLRDLINQTVLAVSNQESRPILTGVHFLINANGLLAVATDSHRLAQLKLDLTNITGNYNLVIPGKSLIELGRMLADLDADIQIKISDNQVLFNLGQTKFYSRLLEGNYPDTSRLIPTESTTTLAILGPDLAAAVERASLLSHVSHNNVVRLVLNPAEKKVILSSTSPDVGNVEEALKFDQLDGEELDISFNPDYLKEALRVLGPATVRLAFTTNLRPFTLVASEDADHYIQLITPVRTFN